MSKIQTRKQDMQYKEIKCCWSIQDEKKNNAENKESEQTESHNCANKDLQDPWYLDVKIVCSRFM